jgi:polysaccharide export outer membrane protein
VGQDGLHGNHVGQRTLGRVMKVLAGNQLSSVVLRAAAAVAACSLALVISACSSSSSAAERDIPGGGAQQTSASLSPAQCDANSQIQAASYDTTNYRIQPGDQLDLSFYLNPEFNDEVIVRPDGKITLRMVGSLQAAGLTPDELAKSLDTAYLSELRNPGASVHVKSMPSREVYVSGRVNHPGSFPLQPGMTALQAVSDAGGFADDAGEKNVVLIRRDMCGEAHGTKINLKAAADGGSADDVALLPHDMVVVPRSGIGNVDQFVQQYIKNVIPVSPFFPIPF